MEPKVIRDSVHGYITIQRELASIIDSIEFQRLKWIEQVSFRVLYPGARHDRFIHSIGTYHVGTLFSSNFRSNIKEDLQITVSDQIGDEIENTFLYAALLHDVGHAPFSHTCEYFFLANRTCHGPCISALLIQAIQETSNNQEAQRFKQEFESLGAASPHEIVSAILLVKNAR